MPDSRLRSITPIRFRGEQAVCRPQETACTIRQPHRSQDRENARCPSRSRRHRQPRRRAEGSSGGNAQANRARGGTGSGALFEPVFDPRGAASYRNRPTFSQYQSLSETKSENIAGPSLLACLPVHAQTVGKRRSAKGKNSMCIGCHGSRCNKTAFPEVYSVPMIAGQAPTTSSRRFKPTGGRPQPSEHAGRSRKALRTRTWPTSPPTTAARARRSNEQVPDPPPSRVQRAGFAAGDADPES